MENPTPAADDAEVIVILTLQFKPGTTEKVLARLVPNIALTRAEPGNKEFQLFQAKTGADKFVILERWQNQASLEWHWEQPYTKEAIKLFEEYLAEPLSEEKDVVYFTDAMKR
jgi:quinol monooxygenase YgiN